MNNNNNPVIVPVLPAPRWRAMARAALLPAPPVSMESKGRDGRAIA
ncbi:hypothetical protein [Paracidovorax wautersii]|uniref:Uncharacterized protein n=1 Tax=Paracidovorax wautersii TaxID=1177982 RepID=A0ABU1IGW1_9BURK|nr:hypothetical protein [Paracidovorax wautersii]MDR6216447.1 hypothetical protein [Paracidovorax wautersii]